MKRWTMALVAALIAALYVFAYRTTGPHLLQDSDTHVAIAKIRERGDPWSWFRGDWPLENHFYRPISTLVFELDNRLYADNAAGYGTTNAILCTLCVLLAFWFFREMTDRPLVATAATIVFAGWHLGPGLLMGTAIQLLLLGALVGGILRHGFRIRRWLPAVLVFLAAQTLLVDAIPLGARTLGWIPGRTATTMTVFCLIALAAYARYERLGARQAPRTLGPLDPPATRNTEARQAKGGVGWALLSVVATALALGSYEQAVMLPACLLAVACAFRWRGFRVRWGWQAPAWGLLVGYLVLRSAILPTQASGYQNQQLRFGPGVWLSLSDYVLPSLGTIPSLLSMTDMGFTLFLMATPYLAILAFARDFTAIAQARHRHGVLALAGWGMAFLAFLPMAWLNHFDHYHYWPLAMRALLVAVLGWIGLELLVTAWSPRGTSAPPRPDPAPGSLPRP
ncbi:MAG: hypothetical protein ACO1SV_26720 [Fimbriimonas sp.]